MTLSVDDLIDAMPDVYLHPPEQWARGFAYDVMRNAVMRPGWKPSPKQLTQMRRLVGRVAAAGNLTLFAPPDGEPVLIDHEDAA